jgi:hypothetical protein
MKRLVLAVSAVVCLAGLVVAEEGVARSTTTATTLQQETTTQMEIYEPKVILQAKFGKGPGEFGGYITPTGEISDGPKNFQIMESGDFCILDTYNGRLVYYDSNGKYLKTITLEIDYKLDTRDSYVLFYFDKKGKIYLFQEYKYFVDKFDSNGRLVNKFIVNRRTSHRKDLNEKLNKEFQKDIKDKRSIFFDKKNVMNEGITININENREIYLYVTIGEENRADDSTGHTEYINISGDVLPDKWERIEETYQGFDNIWLRADKFGNTYKSSWDAKEGVKIYKWGIKK